MKMHNFPRLWLSIWLQRRLVGRLVWRELHARYQGSALGFVWAFVTPLLMLAVYTVVFGLVFKSKWSGQAADSMSFATTLFVGLIVFGFFSECVVRAPALIVSQPNFVKKVVFPLECMAWVTVGSAAINFLIGLAILGVFVVLGPFSLNVAWLAVPVVMLPVLLLTLGIVWFLASLGTFLRDVSQVVGLMVSALMFLTPVFYPLDALPAPLHGWFALNPLAFAIEQLRALLLLGGNFDVRGWLVHLALGWLVAQTGLWWFEKTRKGFADVL